MAIKTYSTLSLKGTIRRLDNLAGPWVSIDDGIFSSIYQDIMVVPGTIDSVIACGSSIGIAVSGNSGSSWSVPTGNYTTLNSGSIFYEVWIVNDNVSYICGDFGAVIKSIDGGATYNQALTFPTASGLVDLTVKVRGLHFITDQIGVVSVYETGVGCSVWKTINGGDTWTRLNGDAIVSAAVMTGGGIYMSGDEVTIIFINDEGVYKSSDSGASFSLVYNSSTEPSFIGAVPFHLTWNGTSNFWITGSNNFFAYSVDTADTWTQIGTTGEAGGIYAAHFYTENDGLFGNEDGGPDTIKYSADKGVTSSAYEDLGNHATAIFSAEIECPEITGENLTPAENTVIGETQIINVLISNLGDTESTITLSLSGCSAGMSIITASPINIAPLGSEIIEIEYTPVAVESGTCNLQITDVCGDIVLVPICYQSIAIPDCPHFNICITGPNCAPACISPGEIVSFDLGGTISPVAYPTIITFSIVNQITNEVIFTESYAVANDAELDAIIINVVSGEPGKYCAEVCLPGCNTKRVLCFDVCEPFDIYKDSCNHWHVHRPGICQIEEYLVTVRPMECGAPEDSVVTDVLWDVSQDNTFEFEVPGDGIYIFEMKDPATGEVQYSFAAFETCKLQECFKIMMDKIMCSCSDPCCKRCDGSPEKEREFSRMSLNKLVPLYMTYLGMARRNELYTVGMKLVADDHLCFLHDACAILAKINDIIMDCGCLCPEQENTATNRGDCLSC